ncbi:MAG: hypothetical protein LUD27_08410 [Clostridia bacterium]|nr:hypothetical protein [Clostridia bacterium]
MKAIPPRKFNTADTSEGVIQDVIAAGFVPFDEQTSGITLMTVFKGRERHCRPKKKKDGTFVIVQSFTLCEGAEDKIFLAVSVDGLGSKRRRKHLYCRVFCK